MRGCEGSKKAIDLSMLTPGIPHIAKKKKQNKTKQKKHCIYNRIQKTITTGNKKINDYVGKILHFLKFLLKL